VGSADGVGRAVSGDASAMDDGCAGKSGIASGSGGGAVGSPECADGACAGRVSAVAVTCISSAIDDDDASAVGGEISRSLDAT